MENLDPAERGEESRAARSGPETSGPSGAVQATFRHLLDVEAEATALAQDAQKEAQNLIAEAEKEFRTRHDAAYSARAAEREAEFAGKTAVLREEYEKLLDAYRAGLDRIPENRAAFNALLEDLFAAAFPGGA